MPKRIQYLITDPNNRGTEEWIDWWNQELTIDGWLRHVQRYWWPGEPVHFVFPNGGEDIYAIRWPNGTVWHYHRGLHDYLIGTVSLYDYFHSPREGKLKYNLATPDEPKPIGQPRHHSLLEVNLNIASGFVVSWLLWVYIVSPWYGIQVNHLQNLEIVGLFTISAIIRGYFWRRLFNRKLK